MRTIPFSILLLALTLAGCRSTGDATGTISGDEANRLTANQSPFDSIKDPKITPQTHFASGQLAESHGNLKQAIKQYELAVGLDPAHQPTLYRLGVLYCQQGAYPKAIETWQRYAKATGGSAVAYSNLGFCLELANQPAEAEVAYKKGLARDPKDSSCRVNFGLMLARRNRVNEALIQFQAVLTPAEAHYNLASVFEQQGRKDQARAEYRKALEMDPKLGDAQARLAALD